MSPLKEDANRSATGSTPAKNETRPVPRLLKAPPMSVKRRGRDWPHSASRCWNSLFWTLRPRSAITSPKAVTRLLMTGFAPLIAGTMVSSIWAATRSDSSLAESPKSAKAFLMRSSEAAAFVPSLPIRWNTRKAAPSPAARPAMAGPSASRPPTMPMEIEPTSAVSAPMRSHRPETKMGRATAAAETATASAASPATAAGAARAARALSASIVEAPPSLSTLKPSAS